ncbi:MAG: flagellar basal-body MS-ring/collar protein FliF [Acidobacteria bacterium]|nr:flagellar basal-body MS-ring/collar protein FliF [Acidobacteriota bacterium]
MLQLRKLWASLSTLQRVTILLVAVAVGTGLFYFSRWRTESDFRPLYTARGAEDAGAVVEKLKAGGTQYRLSEDGRTVLVPSAQVAELRLSLAAAGVPRNGRIGFELFDKANFGATEFTEQVNFRRALEGELERSVVCLSAVEEARVHLTLPKDSVFLESRQQAKASVMVKLKVGARLTPQNIAAVSNLVASAVEGLAPEAVSVLDMQGNLLNRPRRPAGPEGEQASEATLEYRQAMERDLVAKINLTLDPLLGPEKFRASAALDCDFTSGEQSEETFDPNRSVMVTSMKTDETSGSAGASGVPGTASNLPRPASRPATSQGGLSRTTENITYQSSRMVRRTRLPQGTVKRMSVAVLVDHEVKWAKTGAVMRRSVEPPSAEKLKVIQGLVAAVIGLNKERGDQLIVESLPFESTLNHEEPASPPPSSSSPPPTWIDKLKGQNVLYLAALAAVLLLLVVSAAIWRTGRKRRQASEVSSPAELAPGETPEGAAPPGRQAERQIKDSAPAYPELPPVPPGKADILTARLRNAVKREPEASAQVFKTWLTEDEKTE